jgi:hypothetical protein
LRIHGIKQTALQKNLTKQTSGNLTLTTHVNLNIGYGNLTSEASTTNFLSLQTDDLKMENTQ